MQGLVNVMVKWFGQQHSAITMFRIRPLVRF